jgi:hypothetical protein
MSKPQESSDTIFKLAKKPTNDLKRIDFGGMRRIVASVCRDTFQQESLIDRQRRVDGASGAGKVVQTEETTRLELSPEHDETLDEVFVLQPPVGFRRNLQDSFLYMSPPHRPSQLCSPLKGNEANDLPW